MISCKRYLVPFILLATVSLFMACGTSERRPTAAANPAPTIGVALPPTPAVRANSSPSPAPSAFGELRIGLDNFGGGAVDPAIAGGTSARYFGPAIFDSLIGVTDDGKIGPGIAERWDVSPDAKTWTFYIRKGVKFHDGSDLTGADMKFSLERILAPDATSPFSVNLRTGVDRVDLRDDYTVSLVLKKPDPEIWKYLSLVGSASEGLIVPKKYIEAKGVDYFRSNPIGSGPWKLVKYEFNTQMELEALPNHWRAKPQFQKLKLISVPEESTRVAMLKSGALDVIQVTAERVPEIKAAGLFLISVDVARMSGFAIYPDIENMSKYPVGDRRVRKALSLALNRQEIADRLFAGYAQPSAVVGMPSTSIYYDPNILKPDPYDPGQAKALLAEAGVPGGFSIKIYSATITNWVNLLSEALAGYWDKIGVKATLATSDFAAVRALVSPAVHPDLKGNVITWQVSPYPHFGLRGIYFSSAYHHNHNNKDLDAIIEKTEATLDPVERKKLAVEAAVMAKNEYSFISIVDVAELLAAGKNIATWTPIKGFLIPGLEYERIAHAK